MKKCDRKLKPWHQGWYFHLGRYFCQTCDGVIRDEDYLRKIIDYNTPVNAVARQEQIEKELALAMKPLHLMVY